MPRITRGVSTISIEVFLARSSKHFSRWTDACGRLCFRRFFFASLFVCDFAVGEEERVKFPRLLSLSFCFPVIAISLFPFNADRLPFASAFRPCSCHGCFVSGLKISVSHLLIQEILHHGFKPLVAWLCILLSIVLIEKCPHRFELIRLPNLHLVLAFQNIV